MGGGAALAATTGLQVAGGLQKGYAGYLSGQGQERYFNYLSDTSKANAGMAETMAINRNKAIGAEGFSQEQALTRKINQTEGAQRAAVSMGAGTSSRTAQDIIKDTVSKGDIDEMAIRWNTAMRSKGALDQGKMDAINLRGQAAGYEAAGRDAMRSGRLGVANSILGTGTSVASDWTRYPWG